ncbi:hypothetical protein CL630_03040 [bacterium]|nr:hypothetical protein [bacterium]|tara:strand:- start:29314 stop:30129 length:816 start_codon:yes stop_codon:yes gene_type:complete
MSIIKEYLSKYLPYIFWSVVAVLISASLLLFMQFFNEMKSMRFIGQGVEFRNTISISGEGEVTVVPGVAEFSFAVTEEASTVAVAQNTVTEKMNNILKSLEGIGIKEKNIKTLNYNLTPRYEFGEKAKSLSLRPIPPSGERVLVGYEVSHWIEIKMENIDGVGEALAHLGGLGATNISSIRFTVEDEDVPKRDARKKAIKDAEGKARILADDLGVRLIKIVNFSEGGGPFYARNFAVSEAAFGIGGDVELPSIPTGENKVTSNVTISYAIE